MQGSHIACRLIAQPLQPGQMLIVADAQICPGLPCPLSTRHASQLALEYDSDVSFAGQLPAAAVCTFGRMLVPIVHTQPAPPAAGGGVQLYCWLPPDEAAELAAALGGS